MTQNHDRCTFDDDWQRRYTSIFVPRPSEAARFSNRTWYESLFPERILALPDIDHVVSVLLQLIDTKTDAQIMVTNPEVDPQFQDSFLVDASESALADVFYEPSICHFDHVAFSYSASWGIFASNDMDYSAIAGEKSLMRGLQKKLGGEAAVNERFLDYWSNQSNVDATTKRLLLSSVGWGSD